MTPVVVRIVLSLLVFALYLELSPGLGNIWYRTDVTGNRRLSLVNLLAFILNPLYRPTLWQWELLDANSLVFVTSVLIIWYIYEDLVTEPVPPVPTPS